MLMILTDRGETNDIITVFSDGRRFVNGIPEAEHQENVQREFFARMEKSFTVEEDVVLVKPDLMELAKNAARAAQDIAASGFKTIELEERKQRLDVCMNCNHFDQNSRCIHIRKKDGTLERGCGCYMPLKVNFAAMTCPIGKW